MFNLTVSSLECCLFFEVVVYQIIDAYNKQLIEANIYINYIHTYIYTTAAGFEPARAEPSRFLVYLLNHSDTPPYLPQPSRIFLFYWKSCCLFFICMQNILLFVEFFLLSSLSTLVINKNKKGWDPRMVYYLFRFAALSVCTPYIFLLLFCFYSL